MLSTGLAVWHNHRVGPPWAPLQRSGLVEVESDWLVALGYPLAAQVPSAHRRFSTRTELALVA
jgi:hypothetical protein